MIHITGPISSESLEPKNKLTTLVKKEKETLYKYIYFF